jgi:hypothetical protein
MKSRIITLLAVIALCAFATRSAMLDADIPPGTEVAVQTPAPVVNSPQESIPPDTSEKPEWVLVHRPESYGGQGCVRPGPGGGRLKQGPVEGASRGISAGHQDAWFQLMHINTTGRLLRNIDTRPGKDGARLAIYRLLPKAGAVEEVLLQTLIAPPDLSSSPHDVEPGDMMGFVNFPWPQESRSPAGDYVARMELPQPGVEVHFTLAPNPGRPQS